MKFSGFIILSNIDSILNCDPLDMHSKNKTPKILANSLQKEILKLIYIIIIIIQLKIIKFSCIYYHVLLIIFDFCKILTPY